MKHLAAALVIAVAGAAVAQTSPPPAVPEAAASQSFVALSPNDVMASNLIDLTVYTRQNQRVGEIEDLIMDGASRVRAVIVGMGERHIAVNPAALQITRESSGALRAVIDATSEQVKAAPGVSYRGAWSE